MEKLMFIPAEGVCAFTYEWDANGSDYDAVGWLNEFGVRIGAGTAPLPNMCGWIDMSKFSAVYKAP